MVKEGHPICCDQQHTNNIVLVHGLECGLSIDKQMTNHGVHFAIDQEHLVEDEWVDMHVNIDD